MSNSFNQARRKTLRDSRPGEMSRHYLTLMCRNLAFRLPRSTFTYEFICIQPFILLYLLRCVFIFLYESLCMECDVLSRERFRKHIPICLGLISHFTIHNSTPLHYPIITVFLFPNKNVLNVSSISRQPPIRTESYWLHFSIFA